MRGVAEWEAIKAWLKHLPEPELAALAGRALALRPGVHALKRAPGDGSRTSYSSYWCAVNMADALAAIAPRNAQATREALARFFCAWNLYDKVWRRRAAA